MKPHKTDFLHLLSGLTSPSAPFLFLEGGLPSSCILVISGWGAPAKLVMMSAMEVRVFPRPMSSASKPPRTASGRPTAKESKHKKDHKRQYRKVMVPPRGCSAMRSHSMV